ncbi:hypothetical protein R1sor_009832 [Riccia sorocarpa]|uniref:non-specific serine/threonine protein kinase n=1 Tax=Riccia sorocarpa TaxID=122646 RepID=A0ABD3I0B5_9MARC
MALDASQTGESKERKAGGFRAPQENFTQNHFLFGKILGLGSYSKVVKAKKKDTGEEYALKIMEKRHIVREKKVQYVKMERLILDQLEHPGVTRLYFTFQDSLCLYMGLECCNGGELFDQISRKGRLSLEEARFYAAEILDTLDYIHDEGLIHRDIKPENILFTSEGHVKIADYGSAKMLRPFTNGIITCDPNEKSSTFVGTAEYVAPEVLNSKPVSTSADMWALGCVLYQMLEGRPPFKAASEYLTFQKVMARDFVMPQHMPEVAKHLIDNLLNLVPEKRPDCKAVKEHPFFSGIKWEELWTSQPPPLSSSTETGDEWDLAQVGNSLEAFNLHESNSESGSSSTSPVSSPKANSGEDSSTSPSARRSPTPGTPSNLTDDCKSEQWQRFLGPGEKLIGCSLVKLYSRMTMKKHYLLLTDKPRLIIVDIKKLSLKQEFPLPKNPQELYVEVEDQSRFSVRTPNEIWHFEDLKRLAHSWREAIEKLQVETAKEPLDNRSSEVLVSGAPFQEGRAATVSLKEDDSDEVSAVSTSNNEHCSVQVGRKPDGKSHPISSVDTDHVTEKLDSAIQQERTC